MARRITIAFLATVVSLCATHAVPLRAVRTEEIPAIIRLADARCEKSIEVKIARPLIVRSSLAVLFPEPLLSVVQVFPDAGPPRAPPVV